MSERIINFIESADGSVSLVTLTREEAETAIAAILAARPSGETFLPGGGETADYWRGYHAGLAVRDRPGLDAVIEWSAAEDAYGDAVKGLPPEQWDGTTRDTPEWTALRAARDRQRAAYSALRALADAQQREGAGPVGCSTHPGLDAPGCDGCWRVNHHVHDARYVGCDGCLALARQREGAVDKFDTRPFDAAQQREGAGE